MCAHYSIYVEVRGQLSGFGYLPPFCGRVCLVSATALCTPGWMAHDFQGDSPVSASYLPTRVLRLQMRAMTSSFAWVLETMGSYHLHRLSHLSSPGLCCISYCK